ncbi:MAG: hypothetical protein ACOX4W_02870 [Bacilli bacterium]
MDYQDFLSRGKDIIKFLVNKGHESYFVGAVVRAHILGEEEFDDVEIITSAPLSVVREIFVGAKIEDLPNGGVNVSYHGHDYIIRTFPEVKEEPSDKKKNLHYSSRLVSALDSEDFTLNAIAMSFNGKLTDIHKSYNDIKRRKIVGIRGYKEKFISQPWLLIKAIRLVSQTGYKIDGKTLSTIKKRRKYLKGIVFEDYEEELVKLLEGKHLKRALKYLVETKVYKYLLPLRRGLKKISSKFRPFDIDTILAICFVLNKEIDETFVRLAEDKEKLKQIVNLAIANPKGNYSNLDLFSNGLDVCLTANKINNYLKQSALKTNKIKKQFENLPIQNVCNLAFKGEDIVAITKDSGGTYLNPLIDEIALAVLNEEIPNDFDNIKVYAIKKLQETGIIPENYHESPYDIKVNQTNIQRESFLEEIPSEIAVEDLKLDNLILAKTADDMIKNMYFHVDVMKGYVDFRLEKLEGNLSENEIQLRRQNEDGYQTAKEDLRAKLHRDTDLLISKNLNYLQQNNFLDSIYGMRVTLAKQVHILYEQFLREIDEQYFKIFRGNLPTKES